MTRSQPSSAARRWLRWFPWVIGGALVVAVILAALHFSEEREFVRLVDRAQPLWLVWAFLLQAGTYLVEGEVWRVVTRAAKKRVPFATTYKLSLAKLFVDQALPSGGISGTVVIAKGLEQQGVPHRVVMAGVVVDIASYYTAYTVGIGVALVIAAARGVASVFIVVVSVVFVSCGVGLSVVVLALSGRRERAIPKRLLRLPFVKRGLALIADAEPRLARSPWLILEASGLQVAIVMLDAATVWTLIRSLGTVASPSGVFASFMISSLLRIVGILPGGLGTFEAASVMTLKMAGVKVTVALSATLLFRGLSFWLPLIPGLLLSRRAMKAEPKGRLHPLKG